MQQPQHRGTRYVRCGNALTARTFLTLCPDQCSATTSLFSISIWERRETAVFHHYQSRPCASSPQGPAQALPLSVNTQRGSHFLKLLSGSLAQILQGAPTILGPIHRKSNSASPATHPHLTAGTWEAASQLSLPWECLFCAKAGLGMFNTTLFPQQPWGQRAPEMLGALGSHSRQKQSPGQDPRL